MSEIIEAVISNPKTSLVVVAITNFSNWWIEWGNPLVDAAASILSLVLLIVLIRYHLQNTKKLLQKNSKNKNTRND